ncbi:MAG: DUF1015 domain-containing protein [Thermoguttaceae bacterium]
MEIRPFPGFRYNLDKTGTLDDLIAPPYDVIDEAMQEELFAKHPNNVVRLILNRMYPTDSPEDNRYTRTANTLSEWKENGIVVQDEKPAIYVYHQIFESAGKKYTRKGFMCRCLAAPFGHGMVYPHEITMSGPKLDRLMLTTACKMNFSQIFGLYPDSENTIQNKLESEIAAKNLRGVEATDHLGVVHRMWVVDAPEIVESVTAAMAPKPIFIADGHHRYETACNYRMQLDDMGLLNSTHPANYVLMVCIAMEDPGLIVMPTHRLFRGIPALTHEEIGGDYFDKEVMGCGPEMAHKVWAKIEQENRQDAIGLYTTKDQTWTLTKLSAKGRERMDTVASDHHPEWRELGVSLLHRLLIETSLGLSNCPKPTYVHLVDEVVDELKSHPDEYQLAALVSPATVGHIKTLSLLGDRMPAKSTYFYPKLIAGFVFNPLEDR